MDLHLVGKTALVTGASMGIGRAIAKDWPPKAFKYQPWPAALLFSRNSQARSNGVRDRARC